VSGASARRGLGGPHARCRRRRRHGVLSGQRSAWLVEWMTGAGAVSSWSDSIWRSPSTSWTSVPSAAGIAARTEACIITKTMNIAPSSRNREACDVSAADGHQYPWRDACRCSTVVTMNRQPSMAALDGDRTVAEPRSSMPPQLVLTAGEYAAHESERERLRAARDRELPARLRWAPRSALRLPR
jgi:hypothetical protein